MTDHVVPALFTGLVLLRMQDGRTVRYAPVPEEAMSDELRTDEAAVRFLSPAIAVLREAEADRELRMPTESPRNIQVNDVVQIDPAHDEVFGACYLTVTELKAWGVIGYVRVPGHGDKGGEAYYRAPFAHIHKVGTAEWVTEP